MLNKLHAPNLGLLLLRIALGACVIFHGIAKIKGGIGGVKGMLSGAGLPEFIGYGVYLGEFIAPIMIILGIFTRFASLILIGTCFTILYLAFSDNIFELLAKTGGLKAEIVYLYLGGAFCLLFSGGGKFVIKAD
ncbi:DoxX family protein [Campylobacter geochelonis]|uniref:DoxX family protein n=1 Tax=Campylobacter geochelonis TaxID=1780362 RepID=A0A128EGP6_9BACT|nr:DoxX family protein [Campylobacter geochelonis]QKF70827.1 DoxX family protein [Campylobacter geochelonis]CZE47428.1 DoxX family protein [Campylobacter geochelonis]CZE48060.1 DoxX family protein [Campylobacter geochelonis]CZE50596.1 DoxX family protein [Campylobacter geochelonis]